MAETVFKQIDLRYLVNALAQEQTHAGISTFELGLGLDTEGKGNKAERAKVIVRSMFEKPNADELFIQLLNFIYVEDSYANTSSANTVYATLKSNVLDARGVVLTDDGFRLPRSAIEIESVASLVEVEFKMVGEGSYAHVYRYVDPNHGMRVAVKVLKKGAVDADVERFRREFETLKALSFPYIVEVYKFDESRLSYSMEYCDESLSRFIGSGSPTLNDFVRKRIALQLLYGLNYLHRKGICHRDLSFGNVLVKTYDAGAAVAKLSDFGLTKHPDSEMTKTSATINGTIVDPALDRFGDFKPIHDIYALGPLLWFIFTGKRNVAPDGSPLSRIVAKCMDLDHASRYQDVLSVIRAVELLDPEPRGTSA